MPGPPTPVLKLTIPTVGGDANLWGSELNNDLVILDGLGAVTIIPVNFSQAVPASTFPETLVRVSTGSIVITVTLPAPGTVSGKIFTVKKVDSGTGSVNIVASGGALIDALATQHLINQYSTLRMVSNGSSYDIIGVV